MKDEEVARAKESLKHLEKQIKWQQDIVKIETEFLATLRNTRTSLRVKLYDLEATCESSKTK